MNIVWQADQDEATDAPITDWRTEAIPAFPEDDKHPEEYFILRVQAVLDGGLITPGLDFPYRYVVDYHEDSVAAPFEAIASGTGNSLEDAKRQAIRALLDIDARPVEFGWASAPATVYVRVNLRTSTIDKVHVQLAQVTPTAYGAGATSMEAARNPLTTEEGELVVSLVDEGTWTPIENMADSTDVTWEG